MDNNSAPLKPSVFGGFKKKDVLSYIFELNESTQEAQQRLAEQIEELAQSREFLAQKTEEMQEHITKLQTSLDDANSRAENHAKENDAANDFIEKLKTDIANYENILSEKDREIARNMALNAELSEQTRGYEEKRAQVELAASQIAGLLGQAKDDATKVVVRAQDEAAGITREAQIRADSVVKNAQIKADNAARDAQIKADNAVKEAQAKVDIILMNAKAAAENSVADATHSINEAYEKFNSFRSELKSLQDNILDANTLILSKMAAITTSVSAVSETAPEKIVVEEHPTLTYKIEEEVATPDVTPAAVSQSPVAPAPSAATSITTEASNFTKDVLRRYGVRKDDSGFFRLAADN